MKGIVSSFDVLWFRNEGNVEAAAEALQMKGEAEAFAVEAKAKAEAEQMAKKADAWGEYGKAAIVDMILQVSLFPCIIILQ